MDTLKSYFTGAVSWIDARFPLTSLWKEHLAEYYAPKNFNFWYYFGSLAILVLAIQIITGIFLTMNYKPDAALAFGAVEYIMRDVDWGWLIRYMHSTGASMFFVVIYLHMFRGLLYGSYRKPRELIWIFGMLIYLTLMGEAFFGYLLPWGQTSYWGAQVIINLIGAIPFVGDGLSTWVRGDFVVSDATLNRFFAFHVILLPLVLLGLVFAHILALHEVGSNNPDGVEIKKHKDKNGKPLDGIPFHPYYTVKDTVGVVVFLMVFAVIVFFIPDMGGYFLEKNNFVPANSLKGPEEIAPLWYFTPFYSILRATTENVMGWLAAAVVGYGLLIVYTVKNVAVRAAAMGIALFLAAGFMNLAPGFINLEAKVWGVVFMGASTNIFFILPWLDRSPVKSIRYRGILFKTALALFVVSFLVLGYLGTLPPTPERTAVARVCGLIYFAFFLLMPWYTRMDKTKPEPERLTYHG